MVEKINIDVAVSELLAQAEARHLAEAAGYAESGPTYDPAGNYLCRDCAFRLLPDKCAIVKGKISMDTGGCIIWIKGEQAYQEPLDHQFSQEGVIYTERPNVKGFGCKRCEYQKDGYCKNWKMEVKPDACCYANEGEDDVVAPDMQAYGTSEGVTKAWDTRGRGRHTAPPEPEPENNSITFWRGTTTHGLERVIKEGGVQQPEQQMRLVNKYDPLNPHTFTSEKGATYITARLGVAQTYARMKKQFNDAQPGEAIDFGPWKGVYTKPSDGPAPIPNTKPVVITLKIPQSDWNKIARDEASPPFNASYIFQGKIPNDYIEKVNVLDAGRWKRYDWKKGVSAAEEDGFITRYVVLDDISHLKDHDIHAGGPGSGPQAPCPQCGHQGVNVQVFNRPEHADENSEPISKFIPTPAPTMEEREKVIDSFKNAEKVGQKTLPIESLTPLQRTVVLSKLEKARVNPAPKPPAVFYHDSKYYVVDGHHRLVNDIQDGAKQATVNLFQTRSGIHAAMDSAVYDILFEKEIQAAEELLQAYGTSEGVRKAWDSRGRGRNTVTGTGWIKPDGTFVANAIDEHYDALRRIGVNKTFGGALDSGFIRVGWDTDRKLVTFDLANTGESALSRVKEIIESRLGSRPDSVEVSLVNDPDHWDYYSYNFDDGSFSRKKEFYAESVFHGVDIEGFTGPEEEMIRAQMSRVPAELLTNVERVVAVPELQPKHGRYLPDTKTVDINPLIFQLRQRFGEGEGWIFHSELCLLHEIGHSIYYFLPDAEKDKWRDISGWMIGEHPGQLPPYQETRPGWPHTTSRWTHKPGVKFTRKYAQKNDDEDFADSFAFMMLNKPHQMDKEKRAFIEKLIGERVKKYPQALIQGPTRPYGERDTGRIKTN